MGVVQSGAELVKAEGKTDDVLYQHKQVKVKLFVAAGWTSVKWGGLITRTFAACYTSVSRNQNYTG